MLPDGESGDRIDALAAAKAGDFATAEPILKREYARNPTDAEVVEALARGYDKAEHIDAEIFLSRWIELRPESVEPLRMRMALYHKRRDNRAYTDARRLLELSPDDASSRRAAMNHAFSYGFFAESEEICLSSLQRQPKDLSLRMTHAEIRRARGDPSGAAAVYDAVLKDSPNHPPALLGRASLHQEAGEDEKAIPLLREAYKLDPRQRRGIGYQLSLSLDRVGQGDEARKVLAETRRLQDVEVYSGAIQTQPENQELRVQLAERLLADGHTQDGVSLLESVLATDPAFRRAHLALAAHYEKAGQPARAAGHRRRAGSTP